MIAMNNNATSSKQKSPEIKFRGISFKFFHFLFHSSPGKFEFFVSE